MPDSNENPVHIDLDELRADIARQHETVIGADDPILMLATMQNIFLDKWEILYTKHGAALGKYLRDIADQYVGELKAQRDELISKAVRKNVSNTIVEIAEHKKQMDLFLQAIANHEKRMCLLTLVMIICTVVCAFIAALYFISGGA